MELHWLRRDGCPECLVFFSGWGMDPAPFVPLELPECDLLFICDYRTLQPFSPQLLSGYRRCRLLAWSMGVWVAAHLLADRADLFSARTALGGTLQPLDARLGLPPAAYEAMLADFGPPVLDAFYRSMFDSETELATFLAHRPGRSMEALRDEMLAFRNAVRSQPPPADCYTRHLVTSRDQVFPGRNQIRAWGKERCTLVRWPHFPFYQCGGWPGLSTETA
ncbi:MAG: pimeloyl-ACP methyl esterase BioG family protein [Desulfobulbus sp.]|jgi:biotin synthesis protein BioG